MGVAVSTTGSRQRVYEVPNVSLSEFDDGSSNKGFKMRTGSFTSLNDIFPQMADVSSVPCYLRIKEGDSGRCWHIPLENLEMMMGEINSPPSSPFPPRANTPRVDEIVESSDDERRTTGSPGSDCSCSNFYVSPSRSPSTSPSYPSSPSSGHMFEDSFHMSEMMSEHLQQVFHQEMMRRHANGKQSVRQQRKVVKEKVHRRQMMGHYSEDGSPERQRNTQLPPLYRHAEAEDMFSEAMGYSDTVQQQEVHPDEDGNGMEQISREFSRMLRRERKCSSKMEQRASGSHHILRTPTPPSEPPDEFRRLSREKKSGKRSNKLKHVSREEPVFGDAFRDMRQGLSPDVSSLSRQGTMRPSMFDRMESSLDSMRHDMDRRMASLHQQASMLGSSMGSSEFRGFSNRTRQRNQPLIPDPMRFSN